MLLSRSSNAFFKSSLEKLPHLNKFASWSLALVSQTNSLRLDIASAKVVWSTLFIICSGVAVIKLKASYASLVISLLVRLSWGIFVIITARVALWFISTLGSIDCLSFAAGVTVSTLNVSGADCLKLAKISFFASSIDLRFFVNSSILGFIKLFSVESDIFL